MITPNVYNLGVSIGTRNHKGSYVRPAVYKLMSITQSGWALICQDEVTCHYVDPSNLREMLHSNQFSEPDSELVSEFVSESASDTQ